MAISDEVAGLKVTVEVDDQALSEYDDDDDENVEQTENTTTKYVEAAAAGSRFAIALAIDPTTFPFKDNHVRIRLKLDGKKICGWTWGPRQFLMEPKPLLQYTLTTVGDTRYKQFFEMATVETSKVLTSLWSLEILTTKQLRAPQTTLWLASLMSSAASVSASPESTSIHDPHLTRASSTLPC